MCIRDRVEMPFNKGGARFEPRVCSTWPDMSETPKGMFILLVQKLFPPVCHLHAALSQYF